MADPTAFVGYDSRLEWHSAELAALVAAGVLPRGRALDLGCGHGIESLFLTARGWRVVGIDSDRNSIEAALERKHLLPKARRPYVKFEKKNATTFREHQPGTFQVVVERLLYVNLFPELLNLEAATGGESRRARQGLIKTAAFALEPKGIFVMRFNTPDQDEWGEPVRQTLATDDSRLIQKYFVLRGPETGFVGLGTDPHQAPPSLVLTARPMSVLVLERNDSAPPA